MERQELLARLDRPSREPWDIAIVGGGAVGLGAALDAAARGHSCVLFEQHDFCKGTSSRSTKLIHGGVRYLAQGNVSLVREALHERGLLLRNAPSLVRPLRFVVPCYGAMERWYYWTGMKCYDALAGGLGIQPSSVLRTHEVVAAVPGLRKKNLRGGVVYYDAQFDDARLSIAVARKFLQLGGTPLNYMRVVSLRQENGQIRGLTVVDEETSQPYEVRAKVVINAAGAFSDDIRRMESPTATPMIAPSQGIHLVVDQRFLGADSAMMIPKTRDGRVLFAIPWLGRAILGTTDTPVATACLEPKPLPEEVDYLIEHFAEYLDPAPTRDDVRSVFAGLRPLVKPRHEAGATSKISREHRVVCSAAGLVSILGGKWTTFRKMSEDVIDFAQDRAGLAKTTPRTRKLSLEAGIGSDPAAPDKPPHREQVVTAARAEFARTVEDVLARRFRYLLLDALGSVRHARTVAEWMAEELNQQEGWVDYQVESYARLARQYSL